MGLARADSHVDAVQQLLLGDAHGQIVEFQQFHIGQSFSGYADSGNPAASDIFAYYITIEYVYYITESLFCQ